MQSMNQSNLQQLIQSEMPENLSESDFKKLSKDLEEKLWKKLLHDGNVVSRKRVTFLEQELDYAKFVAKTAEETKDEVIRLYNNSHDMIRQSAGLPMFLVHEDMFKALEDLSKKAKCCDTLIHQNSYLQAELASTKSNIWYLEQELQKLRNNGQIIQEQPRLIVGFNPTEVHPSFQMFTPTDLTSICPSENVENSTSSNSV